MFRFGAAPCAKCVAARVTPVLPERGPLRGVEALSVGTVGNAGLTEPGDIGLTLVEGKQLLERSARTCRGASGGNRRQGSEVLSL
jgi:hypothetical protein